MWSFVGYQDIPFPDTLGHASQMACINDIADMNADLGLWERSLCLSLHLLKRSLPPSGEGNMSDPCFSKELDHSGSNSCAAASDDDS